MCSQLLRKSRGLIETMEGSQVSSRLGVMELFFNELIDRHLLLNVSGLGIICFASQTFFERYFIIASVNNDVRLGRLSTFDRLFSSQQHQVPFSMRTTAIWFALMAGHQ